MKSYRLATLVVLLAITLMVVPAASAAGPTGSWVSGIACQNMGNAAATIQLDFYSENNGTVAFSYTDPNTIPVNGSRNYYTPSSPPGMPANFLGAGVVSSDQPLACNVNTQTTGTGTFSAPYRIGTSYGVDFAAAGPTVYVPQVEKTLGGTWSSYIAVQNTESAAAAVTVSYRDRYGAPVAAATEHFTIPGQSNKVFYQADNAGLPGNFLGSAVVTADNGTSKLATNVIMYNAGTSNVDAQIQAYNGVTGGGQTLFVPRIMRNYYGYNGGMSIQNIGAGPTTVTITFVIGGQTFIYNSQPIAANAALALYMPNVAELAGVDALPIGQRYGSAVVEAAAGGTIVAIVNEENRGGPGIPMERFGQGATYNAIVAGTQTNTVLFPQITRAAGGVFSGGLQVANTTNTATTCTISYAGVPAATENNVALPGNGVIARYAPNVANLPDGFNAAATVTCGQAVIGISNIAVAIGSARVGDSFSETTGINK
jgi:hypothetical protein